MKISVIIPVYNAEKYLRTCLRSVLGQSFRDLEVICVDDGSSDGSAAVLAEFAASDLRVRVLSQPNEGQGVARNRGLDAATGAYVYFMDADDELAGPDVFGYLAAEMTAQALDMLLFDAETRMDDGCRSEEVNAADYVRTRDYSAVRSGPQMFADLWRHRDFTVSPCLFISRRGFLSTNAIRFAEGVVHEDNVFMLRALMSARRVSHRRRRLYVRCVHAGTTMTKPLSLGNVRGYVVCHQVARKLQERTDLSRAVRSALRGCARRFRLQVRRLVRRLGLSEEALRQGLPEAEYAQVRETLRRNRLGEALVAGACCLQDRGWRYTARRLLQELSRTARGTERGEVK